MGVGRRHADGALPADAARQRRGPLRRAARRAAALRARRVEGEGGRREPARLQQVLQGQGGVRGGQGRNERSDEGARDGLGEAGEERDGDHERLACGRNPECRDEGPGDAEGLEKASEFETDVEFWLHTTTVSLDFLDDALVSIADLLTPKLDYILRRHSRDPRRARSRSERVLGARRGLPPKEGRDRLRPV